MPPAPSVASSSAPPPPVKRLEPRKSIMGAWKLNRDESDNPRQKSNQRSTSPSTSNPGGYGGPRTGWPGGGMGGGGMGGGRQGNGGPQGGTQSGAPKGGTPEEKERYQELLDPSERLDVEKRNDKDPIVEMMGDQGRKTIFYTDGNKPDAPAGVGTEVVAANWDGAKLVSNDVSLPKGGTARRTYEVSPDGTQLWEEVEMVGGKDKNPSKFRFVYDAVAASDNY